MADRSFIFDRENLVQTLDRECFGESGSSTVIVGGRKVGKSHLLKHLQSRTIPGQQFIYCQVDLSALRAEAGGDPYPSDHHFLKFFLTRLLEQIDTWVEDQQVERSHWEDDRRNSQQRIAALETQGGSATQNLLAQQKDAVAALDRKIGQLDRLVAVARKIRELLDRSEPLKVYELALILTPLKSLRKRVILVIDEYDRFLKEPGFTTNLFTFLRGANNEGKIIALVTSSTHLMDSSLHPELDSEDRKSLFNHFQSQFLVPFTETEADQFLDWLHRGPSKLTSEEKLYLRELGGGTPHFLKVASQEFAGHGRPNDKPGRRDFEKQYLDEQFYESFQHMWGRSSAEEREGLLRAAAGNSVEIGEFPRLEREGYFRRQGTEMKTFSSLFADFLKKQSGSPPAQPRRSSVAIPSSGNAQIAQTPLQRRRLVTARVTPRFQVCPTALYLAAPAYAETVECCIENPTSEPVTILLVCEILNYSNQSRTTCDIEPGQTQTIPLKVTFKDPSVRTLNRVTDTDIRYQVILQPGANEQVLIDRTEQVRLLPLNNFLMARVDPLSNRLSNFTWLIAAWVNKDAAGIADIRRRAAAKIANFGSPLSPGVVGRNEARMRVAALYEALQEERIFYSDLATVFHQEAKDYVQRVRTPDESLNEKAANCLDGAVLFASLLDSSGLASGILLVPGHALVGWNLSAPLPEWEFLETTVLSTKPFDEAFELGQKLGKQVAPLLVEGTIETTIADPEKFAILIDVNRIRRDRKIIPI